MNAMCPPCLCVFSVIGCISLAGAEEKPGPSRTAYDQWVQTYRTGAPTGWFPGPEDTPKRVPVPLRLVVTAIEGDEPQANGQEPVFPRQSSHGCQVAADGRVSHFYHGPMGSKGGGYPTIPDAALKRLDQLLSRLPDDGARLPPPGRRLVLQVPEGDHFGARVYDRANAPDEVWEILRLSLSGVRSWVPEFKSESDLLVGRYQTDGILALTPNGQLVSAVMHGQLQFWDAVTHERLKELPLPHGLVPKGILFSPDGSLAVLTGWGQSDGWVVDTTNWQEVKNLTEPWIEGKRRQLSFPQFSPDGRELLLQLRPAGSEAIESGLRVYDTKTWKQLDQLPGLPDGVIGYFESPKSQRAVVLLKGRVLALWNAEQRREYAKLDEDVLVRQIAFSPDESMVAVATLHPREGKYWTIYRIRIWKMGTGELVHELRPFEQSTCEKVVGLQWTSDAEYVLAATIEDSFFTDSGINIWNVKSGRHRGNLTVGPFRPMGVVMLPGERHIAAGGADRGGSVIRFWDFAAARKQIRASEDGLAEPSARK